MEADLLVLDDIGAEKTSEWVEETMNLIVNTRYNERRLTIFTSNYEEKEDRGDPDSLLARVGFRMHSRLHEMCEFLEYDGADYRHRPPNAGPEDLLTMWKHQARPAAALPRRSGPPGPRAAARRRPKADVAWPGGRAGTGQREPVQMRLRSATRPSTRALGLSSAFCVTADAPRPLPPHPVLLVHLQLLQLQPRPVRRRR